MAANNETRVVRNNSIEEFRQKTNEISLHLGDNKLLDSRLGDKVFSYTASAGQTIFDDARIEFLSEENVDNTAGYIIFTGSPTIPASFTAGATITQTGGFSATIVSISQTKLLIKNSSGTFSASSKISIASDEIAANKIVRLVTESYSKGLLTVTKNGTELVQDAVSTNGFHIPNYLLKVNLTGSPTLPASFTEGATLTQSGGFSGVLLSASSTQLLFKTNTGSFSDTQNLGVPHTDASNRIAAANISSHVDRDAAFGTAIELNTPAAGSDAIVIKSTNLVDAVSEVQDDVGNIANLQTNNTTDLTLAINELELGLRGTSNNLVSSDLTNMTANNVVSAILEHETDIGDVATINDASGYSAVSASTGITELQSHVGTKASLTTTDKTNLVAAINEVDANADASIKLVSGSSQTLNTDLTFGTSGKTLTFGTGTTLDIRSGTLLTGGGAGSTLNFDTAFLNITPNTNIRGLSFERSDHISGAPDVEFRFNELQVSGNKEARAFQLKGLDDSGATNTADIVTFYNAKELITSNTESGIAVDWDSTNQNFDFNVNDFTITLAGDLSGNVTITDLASATLTATVVANSVALGTDTTGDYVQTIAGTANEITVTGSGTESRDVTLALPDDVTIGQDLTVTRDAVITRNLNVNGNTTLGNASSDTVAIPGNLTITGDLTVNGTNTTLNTTTLEVEDTLILTGTSNTEPTTGGFGIETRSFTGVGTHSNNASNVTGSHSLVYNFATDRWEADGSLVLSEATLSSPNVEQNGTNKGDLIGAASLDFKDGEGINPAITLVGGASGDFEVVMNLQEASSSEYGGVKIGYTDNARNYALELDSGKGYVNVPWTDTVYTLPVATSSALGGIKIGYTDNGRNYAVELDGDNEAYVNVPWTDTVYTLPAANATTLGGIELFSATVQSTAAQSVTTTANRTYGLQVNSDGQGVVNVPWGSDLSTTQTTSSDTVRIDSSDGTNATIAVANSTNGTDGQAGVMSRAQVHKLNGIETSANNYSFDTQIAGNTFGSSPGSTPDIANGGRLTIAGGSNIEVAIAAGPTITIANSAPHQATDLGLNSGTNSRVLTSSTGANVTLPEATGSDAGLMSATMHDKLDGIADNATANAGTVTSVLAELSSWLNGNSLPNMGLEQTGTATGAAVLRLASDARCNYVTQTFGNSNGEEMAFNGGTGSQNNIHFKIDGSDGMRLDSSRNLQVDGNVVAFSTAISDERLKENIQVVDGALEKVSQLSGYTFNYKEDGRASAGLLAQEVEKVLPSAVSEVELQVKVKDGTEYKVLEYDQVIALLVESVKELKAEIEELKKHK